MGVLEIRQSKLGDIVYQCKLLNELNLNELVVSFKQHSTIPSVEVMNNLINFLDHVIEDVFLDTSDKILVLELQVILVSSIVGGIYPDQIINIKSLKNHKLLKDFKYLNKLISEIQNNTNNKDAIFTAIKKTLVFDNLNLLLILNGIETTLSEDKLKIIHGRYRYLSHGNLASVRNELCKNLDAKDHLDLLLKLRLIDSYHTQQ